MTYKTYAGAAGGPATIMDDSDDSPENLHLDSIQSRLIKLNSYADTVLTRSERVVERFFGSCSDALDQSCSKQQVLPVGMVNIINKEIESLFEKLHYVEQEIIKLERL